MINNLITIIFIIIIVCLCIFILKTYYDNENFNTEPKPKEETCDFVAWGPNVKSCINNCRSINRVWNNNEKTLCTEAACKDICEDCNESKYCEWHREIDDTQAASKSPTKSKLKPDKTSLTAISFRNSIRLTWGKLDNIESYNLHYIDLNDTTYKINLIKIGADKNLYDLENLKENTEYSFVIYGVNKYGIGDGSDVINIKT